MSLESTFIVTIIEVKFKALVGCSHSHHFNHVRGSVGNNDFLIFHNYWDAEFGWISWFNVDSHTLTHTFFLFWKYNDSGKFQHKITFHDLGNYDILYFHYSVTSSATLSIFHDSHSTSTFHDLGGTKFGCCLDLITLELPVSCSVIVVVLLVTTRNGCFGIESGDFREF